jgi:hypothetical protein
MAYPSAELGELRDANSLLGDGPALRRRMDEDGYLLLRGLIDREKVLRARQTILEYMDEHEGLEPGSRPLDGVMGQYGKSVGLMGKKAITHTDPVRVVLEGEQLFGLFEQLFGEPARTFDYKWLRAVGNEQFTGCHYDVVYMGQGSSNLHTTWIALGDIPVHQGTLAVCEGSHNAAGFQKLRDTYGRADVDRDKLTGWFSEEPREIIEKFGGQWKTAAFQAGDVLIFGMYMLHASTTNVTDRWRLSCDVRFQPARDPVDSRWVGKNPVNDHNLTSARGENASFASRRAEWGV